MSDPKTTEEIQAMIDEAVAGLKTKNEELIAANKTLKADLRKTQEVKPEDLAALESENEALRTKLTAAEKTAKDATTAAEKAGKALETESGFTRKLLVENGLREQLAAAGVTNAVHQKAAMAMLASGVEVAIEGETRTAKVGDKALADYVKEWAAGDEGKHFVTALANGGGGSPGGKGGQTDSKKTVSRSEWDGMDHVARASFSKDGGKVVDQAA